MKTIIKYYTNSCGPCLTYNEAWNQVLTTTPGVQFISIDAQSNDPRIQEHGIRNVPTTVVVENGKMVRKQLGAMSVQQLKSFIG